MAVGQQVLPPVWDVGAMTAAQAELVACGRARSVGHARQLRAVLVMHGVLGRVRAGDSTAAEVALLLSMSEFAARGLLEQAVLLSGLPGGLEAVESGLLGIDQAALLTRRLSPLSDEVRRVVWARVVARLQADEDGGIARPPARLGDLLTGWILKADPAGATARRRAAAQAADVEFRRREDGLGDLLVFGIPAAQLQAILLKIRALSQPFGAADLRSAGQRRLDVLVDLLLGRRVQLGDPDDAQGAEADPFAPAPASGGASCGVGCGCRAGEPVPCGMDVSVLLPLGAGLGTTDELAVLDGHGPLEPDMTAAVLITAPRLRPVWVDDTGLPVAVGDTVISPPRGDLAAVRDALLTLAALPPPEERHPRHPNDHQHPPETEDEDGDEADDDDDGDSEVPPGAPEAGAGAGAGEGAELTRPTDPTIAEPATTADTDVDRVGEPSQDLDGADDDRAGVRPQLLRWPHPTGTAGAYRVPSRLRRLLRVRSPRCEWPGCGTRASRCDLDHDRAWPEGPTCACNLGPLCRFHHRRKQQLMRKTRQRDGGVRWTDPTGRSWLSPHQHPAPEPALRTLPGLRTMTEQEHADLDTWAEQQDRGCSYEDGCVLDDQGSRDGTGPGTVSPTEVPAGTRDGCAHLDPMADRLELRADDPFDTALDDTDVLGQLILHGDGWGLALDDPTHWSGEDLRRAVT